MDGSSPFEPCPLSRRQLFWNLAAHDHLDRERQSKGSKNMLGITALLRSFAFAKSLLCLPILRQKLVGKVVLYTFRQQLHIIPELMCLRRATCLSYFLFFRWKNLGKAFELDPKGDKIKYPAFGLYSSPAEYSTTVSEVEVVDDKPLVQLASTLKA